MYLRIQIFVAITAAMGLFLPSCNPSIEEADLSTQVPQSKIEMPVVGEIKGDQAMLNLTQEECVDLFLRFSEEIVQQIEIVMGDGDYYLEGVMAKSRMYIELKHDPVDNSLRATENAFSCTGVCDCRKNSASTDCICYNGTVGYCAKKTESASTN